MFYVICIICIYEHPMYISHVHVYGYGTYISIYEFVWLGFMTHQLL